MPAPDLPPPPPFPVAARPLGVFLHVLDVDPEAIRGGVVIMIDALRASVTMAAALASGAARVHPVLTVEDAFAKRESLRTAGVSRVLLGGERGGVLVPGFDLDNSPARYTPGAVRGADIVFSTTNGTAALLACAAADRVLVGSFANLAAVCDAVLSDPRPVWILACGTRNELSLDDVLPAGAMVERLVAGGRELLADDAARVAVMAWRGAQASPGGVLGAMHASRGGRNLAAQGLGDDVELCTRQDWLTVVPTYHAGDRTVTA